MYDARAVANYFLDRAVDKSLPLTSMSLLKIMFFAHAWFLAQFNRPLVAQPFEAWKYGPVCRLVYDQVRNQGQRPIRFRLKAFSSAERGFVEAKYNFHGEEEKLLADVFDYYSQYHAFALSDITHIEGSPWYLVWEKAEQSAVPGMIIPNTEIRKWFREEYSESPSRAKGRVVS